METSALFLPPLVLSSILLISARSKKSIFIISSVSLIVLLLLLSYLYPTITVSYKGPKWASGYDSWVFPVAAVALTLILSVWRYLHKPGFGAALVCLPICLSILYLGAWVS
jgi:hypothetical protein